MKGSQRVAPSTLWTFAALAVVWGIGLPVFVNIHGRFDRITDTVLEGLFIGTAATVICLFIATRHRRTQRVVLGDENVVPIRPREDDTVILPRVVGRHAPIGGATRPASSRPRLTYTAGDHTLGLLVEDYMREDGRTG